MKRPKSSRYETRAGASLGFRTKGKVFDRKIKGIENNPRSLCKILSGHSFYIWFDHPLSSSRSENYDAMES